MTGEGADLAPEVPSVQGAAARCRGLLAKDPDVMRGAVEYARRSSASSTTRWRLRWRALVLSQAGRTREAAASLHQAMALYEELDARAWAARTRAALRRLGVRPGTRGPRRRPTSGWDSLTTSERDVALLVAEGLTNRQVANRLHISPHTVNTHLRRVFEKLDVSNRTELAATMARFSQPAR